MPCTSKRRDRAGEASTFTLTSFNRPAKSVASCSSAGLTVRHGPHHSAHRSTSTGTEAASTTVSNSSSPLSVIQGSGVAHFPHLGTPDAPSGTRFFVPQLVHRTIVVPSCDITSESRALPVTFPTMSAMFARSGHESDTASRSRDQSAQVRGHGLRPYAVAPIEQHGMDQQGIELEEGDTILPART
jgi:hypothetical protein